MKSTIAKIIQLAHLRIPAEELQRFADKAQHIVDYVEQLKQVDTKNVAATAHALEVENNFREDEVNPFPTPEKILAIAPERQENFLVIPKVIE